MTDLHKTTEPVCWAITGDGKFDKIEFGNTFEMFNHSVEYWIVRGYEATPLYAAPPSIDALIAEAVEKEREACAQIGEAFDKERPQSNYGRCLAVAIRARGQK